MNDTDIKYLLTDLFAEIIKLEDSAECALDAIEDLEELSQFCSDRAKYIENCIEDAL